MTPYIEKEWQVQEVNRRQIADGQISCVGQSYTYSSCSLTT